MELKDRKKISFIIDLFVIDTMTRNVFVFGINQALMTIDQSTPSYIHFFSFIFVYQAYFLASFVLYERSLGMILMKLKLLNEEATTENGLSELTLSQKIWRSSGLLLNFLSLGLVATQMLGEKGHYLQDYMSSSSTVDQDLWELEQDRQLYQSEMVYIDINSIGASGSLSSDLPEVTSSSFDDDLKKAS